MPVMNGYEFVTKVRQINPDVKICLMSTFEVNDLDLNSVKIDEFLQKPLSIGKLTEIIGGMLGIYNKSSTRFWPTITKHDTSLVKVSQ